MRHVSHHRRAALALVLVVTSAALGACGWFGTEPERRARGFVEALVREPGEREALNAYVMQAPGVDPLVFTTEAPMRVALEYLRARHTTGEALEFSAFETAQPNPHSRRVAVRVRVGAARPAADEVMLALELERETGGAWLVTHAGVMP